jgi:hypothetical protein
VCRILKTPVATVKTYDSDFFFSSKEEDRKNSSSSSSSSSSSAFATISLELPDELPSVEEALKVRVATVKVWDSDLFLKEEED